MPVALDVRVAKRTVARRIQACGVGTLVASD
jgi:hypothetical protein